MKKTDCLFNYVNGCLSYYDFLSKAYSGVEDDSLDLITNLDNTKYASLGIAALLINAIKEDLIDYTGEKKNKIFYSKTFESGIEKVVDDIAEKKNNQYYIGGVYFNSKEEVIEKLRNKLAHGDFLIDIENNKVIFEISKIEFGIGINKLLNFVVSLATVFFSSVNENVFGRKLFIIKNNLSKEITNPEDEYFGLLNDIDVLSCNLVRKDNKSIEQIPYAMVSMQIENYKRTHDKLFLDSINDSLKEAKFTDYEFSYKIEALNLTRKQKEKYARILNRMIPLEENYYKDNHNLISTVGSLLHSFMSEEPNKIIAKNCINMLIHLRAIKVCKTSDRDTISDYIYKNYRNRVLKIDDHTIFTCMVNLFNSMFNYCNDDILFEYFNYASLNLSDIEHDYDASTVKKDYLKYQDICDNKMNLINLKEQTIENIKNKIEDLKERGYKISNSLENSILNIKEETQKLNEEYEYNQFIVDFKSKPEYIKNRHIITGIRNSISHGRYRFEIEEDTNNSLMIFTDIDPETSQEYVFKVTIKNFVGLLVKNAGLMQNFFVQFDSLDEEKLETKKEFIKRFI